MKIDVYDSYANCIDGRTLHFDVLVRADENADTALHYGKSWLTQIGESPLGLSQSQCRFCHSEIANPEIQHAIETTGFFIIQMEGCPAPM